MRFAAIGQAPSGGAKHDLVLARYILDNWVEWTREHNSELPIPGLLTREAEQMARTALTLAFLGGYQAGRRDPNYISNGGLERHYITEEEKQIRGERYQTRTELDAFTMGARLGTSDASEEAARPPPPPLPPPPPPPPPPPIETTPPPAKDPIFELGALLGARASDLQTTPLGLAVSSVVATAPLWAPVLLLPWLRGRGWLRA